MINTVHASTDCQAVLAAQPPVHPPPLRSAAPASLTHDYLGVPRRLVVELRDTPLALAIYLVIARLYVVQQQPVPLSRGDLQKIDPSAKAGALKRALDRLTAAGWLVESAGYKRSYLPSWGTTRRDVPYVWRAGAPLLGCPQYIWRDVVRIDRMLLDLFVGKFTPHMRNPTIERYFTTPLLSLLDVGAYICAAAGFTPSDEAAAPLVRWGLLRDGVAQAIPDTNVVIALASQRATADQGQLTTAAWRKLGWLGTAPAPDQPPVSAAPLIFVPHDLIGQWIGQQIGQQIACATSGEVLCSALERPKTLLDQDTSNMTRMAKYTQDSKEPPPNPPEPNGGGSTCSAKVVSAGQPTAAADPSNTPAALLLRSIHAYPASVEEFAQASAGLVQQTIDYAQAQPNIWGVPNMVIAMLRRHRDEGWQIPTAAHHGGSGIDIAAYTDGSHGDLFRLGSDVSGLAPAEIVDVQPNSDDAAQRPPSTALPTPRPASPPVPPAVPSAAVVLRPLAEIEHDFRAIVSVCCGRAEQRLIRALRLRIVGATTLVYCASPADRVQATNTLLPRMRVAVAELGLPSTIRITDGVPPDERADWPVQPPALTA